MTVTSVGVFTTCESEKQQLIELRQHYIERGAEGIDRTGPDDIFENLKELLAVSQATLEKIANEKEVELLLNSLFSLFISFKEEQLAELVKLYCQLLTGENFRGQGWNSLAGIAVRLLSNIFRLHVHLPPLQFVELNSLLQMAGRARLTQFLDIGMPQIDEFAKRWNLDIEKHRELYRTLHAALCRDERHEQAAEVMTTLLKTYTQTDANKAREDARECVRTAVVDPKAFYFDHLLDLSAVKSLEQTDPLMHKVLNIFVNHGLAQFRQFNAENPTFVQEQLKVDAQVLEKKIKMLSLISMAEKKQLLSLAELSKQLDIPDEEQLEEFLIDAIRAEAINGRIDDLNGRLEVTFYQQRVFGHAQWEQLQSRIAILIENLKDFRQNLDAIVPNGGGAN